MKLDFEAKGVRASRAVARHVQRRVAGALSRLAERIAAVRVRLEDVNGPRGGRDKLCAVVCRMSDGSTIVVREQTDSVWQSIDRAADRVQRAVRRKVNKLRERRRRTRRTD